ncbi:hypothetical protein MHU86_21757 [Fragilaria crotonensis]|nr:hypothetical protein MHU86_21757 [Fragilaria crotonensis]
MRLNRSLNGPDMPTQMGTHLIPSWAIAIENVDVLFQSVTNAQRLLPAVVTVEVPHGPPCDVIAYEFAPQLLNLLQNPSIMTAENLLIDLNNPLVPYQSPDGRLGMRFLGVCIAMHTNE